MLSRRGSEAEDISALGVSVRPRSSVAIGLLHNSELLESGPDLSLQAEAARHYKAIKREKYAPYVRGYVFHIR